MGMKRLVETAAVQMCNRTGERERRNFAGKRRLFDVVKSAKY